MPSNPAIPDQTPASKTVLETAPTSSNPRPPRAILNEIELFTRSILRDRLLLDVIRNESWSEYVRS